MKTTVGVVALQVRLKYSSRWPSEGSVPILVGVEEVKYNTIEFTHKSASINPPRTSLVSRSL